jgi:hypothetical protein
MYSSVVEQWAFNPGVLGSNPNMSILIYKVFMSQAYNQFLLNKLYKLYYKNAYLKFLLLFPYAYITFLNQKEKELVFLSEVTYYSYKFIESLNILFFGEGFFNKSKYIYFFKNNSALTEIIKKEKNVGIIKINNYFLNIGLSKNLLFFLKNNYYFYNLFKKFNKFYYLKLVSLYLLKKGEIV